MRSRQSDEDQRLLGDAALYGDDDLLGADPVERAKKLKKENIFLKCFLVLFVLAVCGLLTLIAVYYLTLLKANTVCETAACVELAGNMVAAMNKSVDPCDNFYEYACGGWIKSHILPSYMGMLEKFSILGELNTKRLAEILREPSRGEEATLSSVRKAKDLYASCLDTKAMDKIGAAPVMEVIDNIKGTGPFNYEEAYINIAKRYTQTPFFLFTIESDPKNNTLQRITFRQADLGMGAMYYSRNATTDRHVIGYKAFMTSAFELLNMSNPKALVDGVFELEKKIANITASLTFQRNPYAVYNLMTLDALQKMAPAFNYLNMSHALVDPEIAGNITGSEEVIVKVPSYMKNISEIIKKAAATNDTSLETYMIWTTIRPLLYHLSTPFRSIIDEYHEFVWGITPRPRVEICVRIVKSTFGFATGRLFVDHYFSFRSKIKAWLMIWAIKKEFKANLDNVKWMDDNTKQLAKDKVDAVRPVVGYFEAIKNDTILDMLYGDYDLNFSCFACSMISCYNVSRHQSLQIPFAKGDLGMTASTVNAYYSPERNVIKFPAGILQAPFYEEDYITAVKYGAIGTVMGHELTHGFDDQGSQYDMYGNLRPWWPKKIYKAFNAKTQCLARQYSNYSLDGRHVNGRLTLGENIADHGGMKMSYNAYKTWKKAHPEEVRLPGLKDISEDQLFFLSFAQLWCAKETKQVEQALLYSDPHSPGKYRVMGTLSTSQAFVDAWQCKAGSPMNRANKCVVW